MDEVSVADVHTHMADRIDAVREEHKVTGLELALGYGHAVVGVLKACPSLELIAVLLIDVVRKARAVKALG